MSMEYDSTKYLVEPTRLGINMAVWLYQAIISSIIQISITPEICNPRTYSWQFNTLKYFQLILRIHSLWNWTQTPIFFLFVDHSAHG